MDKSWVMLADRMSSEYLDGVTTFINVAKNHLNEEGKTRCPCKNCMNIELNKLEDIERHMFKYGMSPTYVRWIFHGEQVNLSHCMRTTSRGYNTDSLNQDQDRGDEMCEMLNDLHGPMLNEELQDDTPIGYNEEGGRTNFSRLVNEVEEELYPGCEKFSSFNFLVKLMHIKVLNKWSDKSFDMLLQLLNEAFPSGVRLPTSYYEAKKRLRDLGLGYETIHACKYDCALFWKEYATYDHCPHCGESRYKINDNKGKKIPHKVLRYFPLKERLKRLYLSKHTAKEMRWHKEKRCETKGTLRHPADAEGWKHFDSKYPLFAADARNVRLALSSDGFNPFGNMSTSYSMWPVMLIPYNLPPWKCMREPFFFMTLLIPGPRSPGKDIS